jgi:hypothetical protein
LDAGESRRLLLAALDDFLQRLSHIKACAVKANASY